MTHGGASRSVPPVSGTIRIAIDLRPLSLDSVSGVGLVLQLLLEELEGRGATFVGVTHRPVPSGRIPSSIPVTVEPGRGGRIRWEAGPLPSLLRQLTPQPDLYHAAWNHGVPGGLPFPSVLTIYDMIPWRFPREVPWPKPWWLHHALYRRAIRASARAATSIVTSSEASRRDIAALIPDAPARAEVVPVPLPRWFRATADPERLARRGPSATRPTWLYLGGFEPRKEIETLLRAMSEAFPDRAAAPELILAGAINDYARAYEAMARKLEIPAKFPGYVADADLANLFGEAALFLYPSRHEGFGIPLLFAMAAGIPSVASDGGSLPEVLGDAGIIFPAGDVAFLAAILKRAAADPESLAVYGTRGRERIRQFTPEAFAKRMIRVYEQAAGSRAASA